MTHKGSYCSEFRVATPTRLDRVWEICGNFLEQFSLSLLMRWYLCACSSERVSAQTTRLAKLGGLLF